MSTPQSAAAAATSSSSTASAPPSSEAGLGNKSPSTTTTPNHVQKQQEQQTNTKQQRRVRLIDPSSPSASNRKHSGGGGRRTSGNNNVENENNGIGDQTVAAATNNNSSNGGGDLRHGSVLSKDVSVINELIDDLSKLDSSTAGMTSSEANAAAERVPLQRIGSMISKSSLSSSAGAGVGGGVGSDGMGHNGEYSLVPGTKSKRAGSVTSVNSSNSLAIDTPGITEQVRPTEKSVSENAANRIDSLWSPRMWRSDKREGLLL